MHPWGKLILPSRVGPKAASVTHHKSWKNAKQVYNNVLIAHQDMPPTKIFAFVAANAEHCGVPSSVSLGVR